MQATDPSARSCDRAAVAALALASLALLAVVLFAHAVPLLGVETDLLGDSIPAARALAAGHLTAEAFQFRGPGYPLLLAGASWLAGGDAFLGARLLNVASAAATAGLAWLVFRTFMGPRVALAVLLGLWTNPVFVRAAIEAGTDMPALALALAATGLVTRGGGWRTCAAGGLAAGCAYLTRYNMVFLAPAGIGALMLARADGRRIAAFVAGLLVPIGGWMIAHSLATGQLPHNRNFLNVAYEVYGQGMAWDRFWAQAGSPFGSLIDVVLYDPARFAAHVGWNALARWIQDARTLMPVWIGALAVPGIVVGWWRRPGWGALALHFGLAYLVLTLVFYTPRFFLYLLPFYLSGTFGLLLHAYARHPEAGGRSSRLGRSMGPLGSLAAAALLVLSTRATIAETRRLLADPPVETRLAGELLRTVGRPGERVLARKPHVAYFAGMEYVPIPYAEAFTDCYAEMRRTGAQYLFISSIEARMHKQLSVLADSGVTLPGLVPLAHRVLGGPHFYALYRLTPDAAPVAVVQDSLLVALRRQATRSPDQAWPHTSLGGHLVTMGRFRESLAPLVESERLDPSDPLVLRFRAMAHAELGELEAAAAACERAMALVPGGSWEQGYLGEIRLRQGRIDEAREWLRQAMDGAPTDPRYPILYLRACARAGAWHEAAAIADRLLRSTPDDASARLFAARAWLALGRPEAAHALTAWSGVATGPDSARWAALADSLRAAKPRPR